MTDPRKNTLAEIASTTGNASACLSSVIDQMVPTLQDKASKNVRTALEISTQGTEVKGKKRAHDGEEDDEDDWMDDDDVDDGKKRKQEKKDRDTDPYKSREPQDPAMDAFGIIFAPSDLVAAMKEEDTGLNDFDNPRAYPGRQKKYKRVPKKKGDFFDQLSVCPEVIIELALHMTMPSIVTLYCVSKAFHETINGHISHFSKQYVTKWAPESCRIYRFNFYGSLCGPDPVGRTIPGTNDVRLVPTLQWSQMVVHREKAVKHILACMAREGHRMPDSMRMTLKKLWMVMDIATSRMRAALMHNEEFMTDFDIYNIQLFCVKLDMRFNDPLDGPGSNDLTALMLGQRGLTPLLRLLKRERFLTVLEITQAQLRYFYRFPPDMPLPFTHMPLFGIPPGEVGVGHLEGWGAGRVHLYRPDELCFLESARRFLALDRHVAHMMLYGYINFETRQATLPTEEEMYMSDDDRIKVKGAGWEGPSVVVPREEEWVTDDEQDEGSEAQDDGEDGDSDGDSDNMDVDEPADGVNGSMNNVAVPFRTSFRSSDRRG